jgi:hypothetical protein
VSWSETESARANEQVVRGETETPRARRRLVVRGRDSLEKLLTRRRLVEEASNWSEVRRLASDGIDRVPQPSLY